MPGFKEKIIVDYIWEKDEMKKKMAEMHGFKVCYLWENDYKLRKWESIAQCIREACDK